ncbi:MAG: hypothetical protein RIK87_12475 [Fuerstiella sp.]
MSDKVRLITFERLPNPVSPDLPETLAQAVAALAEEWTVFESHYLQQPGISGITQPFDDWSAGCDLRDRFRSGQLSGVGFRSRVESAESEALPDWISWETPAASVGELLCPSAETRQRMQDADFCWLHVAESVDESSVGSLKQVVELISSWSAGPRDLTLITALHGTVADQQTPFASLLWESRIRVPLWMHVADRPAVRVPIITGSFDIACTINNVLSGRSSSSAESPAVDAPRDLVQLSDFVGCRMEREILIRLDRHEAVRTSDFLFVQQDPADHDDAAVRTEKSSALYAKPEDIWNVNDVSGEYFEVAERFRQSRHPTVS